MRRLLTVRNRTTIVAALVVAAALAVAAVGLVALLRDRLVDAERTAAELRARDVAALVESGDLPDDLSFPGEDEGLTQVVAADGRVLAATDNLEGEAAISALRPEEDETESEIIDDAPIGDGDGERFVIVATTVETDDGPVTVISSSSLEGATETVRAVSIALGLGIPVLVGLVAIVTRLLIGRALHPVERMRREASQITDEDLHRRLVEPGTGDEIDLLAGTLNEMLARLEVASERQRRFVADASHELRSPLTSARAALEVAVAHPDKIDATRAMTSALADQARLEQLVDDLLILARTRSPGSGPSEPVDLGEVVAEEVAAAGDPRIEVRWTGPRPVLAGDRRAIARVVRNLVDNARRHADERVRIQCSASTDAVALIVEDDGEGIAAEDRERIFDRFTRLDEARAREAGGSGLGLSIVRAAVEDLGGTVSVSDSDLGGAALTVRVPLAPRPPGAGAS